MRYISFFIQLALNIVTAIFAFIKAVGSRGVAHKRNMLVFLLGLTMTVAFSIQLIWPLLPFTALGCLIGSCFFRAYVIDDEIEEMRKAVIEREQAVKHMAELEAALERARAAEQSRSTFFSIVSHDISTPLNAILGYSELLQGDMATRQERDDALKSISASGKVLLQLVNDVLDFAKIDSGRMMLLPVPVKLEGLTDEVFATFRLAASEKGVQLINRTGGVPVVVLDEHRILQIIFNLVGNDIKFTDAGSVTVSAAYDGPSLKVSVADTGCGIPHDMLRRIFDPFVQVLDPSHSASRASGSGLGLSICKRLTEIMGGELTVESEPSKGSTFTIIIPDVPTSEAEARASILASQVVELKNPPKRVLVVDDSAMNRSVLKAFLKKAGVGSIDEACDGCEALMKLRSAANGGNVYDFVFTDFWMPNMNGVELVERLRADLHFRGLPVFAVTADSELQNDERSKLFTGILFKPLMYDMLVGAIASCDA